MENNSKSKPMKSTISTKSKGMMRIKFALLNTMLFYCIISVFNVSNAAAFNYSYDYIAIDLTGATITDNLVGDMSKKGKNGINLYDLNKSDRFNIRDDIRYLEYMAKAII